MALLVATLFASRLAASEPPNFVVVIADDQRWDGLGVVQREKAEEGRFQWLETPHLDRLAAEGVRFRNAFVVTSVCSPARASFLTGRYGHEHGVVDNKTPLPVGTKTFASFLRRAGYRTGYVGKWHMGEHEGRRPRFGFDFSASYRKSGYLNASFEIDGVRTKTEGFVDDVATDQAIGFLQRQGDDPFLLVVGFKAPHGRRVVPARLRAKYSGRRAGPARSADHVPPFFEEPALTPPSGRGALRGPASEEALDKFLRGDRLLDYFRLISSLDENVGRLLAALDELALNDRTVVIFVSDNGFYLAEHSLGGKCSAYEESIRIPLLVRHPGLGEAARGKVVDEIALNIDLAPTLLDLAGVAVPVAMQGHSWRPLLSGKAADWRRSFLYEYTYSPHFPSPTIVALRSESVKLIRYPGFNAWTELFDLAADPYELNNLATKRPALLAEMERELEIQAQAVGFRVPEQAPTPAPKSRERAPRKSETRRR